MAILRRGRLFSRIVILAAACATLTGGCRSAGDGGDGSREPAAALRQWPIPDSAPGAEPYPEELRTRLAEAVQALPHGYEPRTHHLRDDGSPEFINRLVLENSPYLRQHAHNPVDWHAWGDAPFEKARRLGLPVLLSVGYSTCHWCHVMERESFEDLEIAEFLNSNFVAIKVDREERPDVDVVYMEAVRLLTRGGGWPMTVMLTPDREPFFGGTYFPARDGDRGSRKGFLTIARELSSQYRDDRESLVARAAEISERMRAMGAPQPAADLPPAGEVLHPAVLYLARSFDRDWGGFGRSPKFPRPSMLEPLMRYHRRTGHEPAREMFEKTLEAMAEGGMYDHAGGGFHRYSVDTRWLVPHFEKMLYDNAQLVIAYLDGAAITGREDFRRVARETLDYILREMTSPEGGFYSATDADSPAPGGHQEEGLYFTWTLAELLEVLGPDRADIAASYYGVTERGNFEGRSILHSWKPLATAAGEFEMTEDELSAELEVSRKLLLAERARREPPGLDNKILAGWNGLMISAMARGRLTLGDERYGEAAVRAARFVLDHMRDGERVYRSYLDGKAGHDGVLDDYAFLAGGLLDVFEITGDPTFLQKAISLYEQLHERFRDEENGGYWFTPSDGEELLTREKPAYDGARPSGNSVALQDLLRLHEFTGEEKYRQRAEELLRGFSSTLTRRGLSMPKLLAGLDAYSDVYKEIVFVRLDEAADLSPFLEKLAATYVPSRVIIPVVEGDSQQELAQLVPLAGNKKARNGHVTAYVCENRVCKFPTTEPETFARQLAEVAPYPVASSE